MFDTEELKSKFEIPYLKGEMGKEISNFKKFKSEYRNELDVFLHKILFRYPVISKFHQREVNGVPVFFATSKTEAEDGHEHYAQIAMTYENNEYNVVVIMRRLEDTNERNWFVKTYGFPTIEESYHFFDMFIGACKKYNIIEDSDTFDPFSN